MKKINTTLIRATSSAAILLISGILYGADSNREYILQMLKFPESRLVPGSFLRKADPALAGEPEEETGEKSNSLNHLINKTGLNPNVPGHWADLGKAYMRKSLWSKARYCFQKAIDKGCSSPEIYALSGSAEFYDDLHRAMSDNKFKSRICGLPVLHLFNSERTATAINMSEKGQRKNRYIYTSTRQDLLLLLLKSLACTEMNSSGNIKAGFQKDELKVLKKTELFLRRMINNGYSRKHCPERLIGIALLLKKDYVGSEKMLLLASKINPEDLSVYDDLAFLYQKGMNNTEKAISALVRKKPEAPDANCSIELAAIYYKSGALEAAENECRNALMQDDSCYPAMKGLAVIYAVQKKYSQALIILEKARRAPGISPKQKKEILKYKALTAILKNDKARAYILLKKLINADKKNDELKILMKRIYNE